MNTDKAQATVVTCMAVTAALRVADAAIKHTGPTARVLLGLGFSTIALAALAVALPALAASLALLVTVTAVFVYGGPVWSTLARTL